MTLFRKTLRWLIFGWMILCAGRYLPAQGITTTGGVTFSATTAPVPPHITSGNPPNGTQGAGYQFNFTGTCPVGPCNWTRLSGTLPPGTTLDTDGTLHATVLGSPGTYSFSVKLTDNFTGLMDSNPLPYQVVVNGQVPGVFLVPSGGNNAAGCTFLTPCNGDSAGFTAAKTAVKLLPSGSKTVTLRGAVPSNQEDMLDWLLIGVSGRTGLHKTGTSLYDANWLDADGQKLWQEKGSGGNPWDIETYGAGCPLANYICDWITENGDIPGGFNNAFAYKKLIIPVPIMPRFFTPGTRIVVDTVAPKSKRTANCEQDNPPDTSPGDVRGVLEGPFTNKDFGLDIGIQPYLLNSYYYSGTLATNTFHDKELRYYVKGMGRVLWEHYTCSGSNCSDTSGTWVFQQDSLKNILTAGAAPVPNFPCGNTIPNWVGGPVPTAGQNLLPDASGIYRLSSTLTFGSSDGGTGIGDRVTWKNYPGESAKISGLKRITGLSYLGSGEYTVSLPAASWQNFEMLLVNGVRRPRPRTDTGSAHGYYPNNCPTTTNDDSNLCKAGADVTAADTACGCPAAFLALGKHCAGLQTKVCTIGGSTPWQCFNKYEYSGSDISGSWHGLGVGDVEILPFETWTMPRQRLNSASGGLATFKGATQTSNDHGCQGGHFFIADNVKELAGPGDWYLDRDADNNGVLDSNMTLHIWANPGENILGADIEVPQLAPSTPLLSATGINWFSLVSNNTGSFAGIAGMPVTSGLFFEGDNWQPPATGYTDAQGMPDINGALSFTTANNILLDGITVQHTMGWGVDFQGTSTHNTLQNSHLTNLGAGGIRFGTSVIGKAAADPGDTDANVPQFNTVTENLIDNIGRVQPGGEPSGIMLGDGHHNSFQHNEIANSYVGGIQMCFGLKRGADDGSTTQQFFCHDNDVGFNLIYDQPNPVVADHAGIYAAPSYSTACPPGTPLTGKPCNTIHDNVIHDIFNNYDLTGTAATSGGRGLYCDQGCTNVLFKNNLVYRTGQSGIFLNDPQHTGPNHFLAQNNLVDNNIFAFFGYQNVAFTVSLAKSCIANSGQGPDRFTFQHNICYGNFTDSLTNMQILPSASWICYADDLTTQIPCSQRFVFANNGYWNISGTNPLAFAVCKTVACPNPFNNTNYWRFGPANGVIPTAWQAAWQLDGAGNLLGAGEDSNSVAVDPVFISTTCGTENWHYNHSFAPQGIVQFDYTQAGRKLNTFPIPSVPDLFPIRPINCSDFAGAGGIPVATLSGTSLSFGSQVIFTTSSTQAVTITNTGTATLNFTSITVSGDFAQANDCIPSLAPSAVCTITASFTPTVLGARTGAIVITDNAAGSPQTISLTGTGTSGASAGDNRYCNSSNVVVGLSDDTWGTVTAAKLAACINTAVAQTPSQTNHVVVVTSDATMATAVSGIACGDIIRITAGTHLVNQYTLPSKGCAANNWITIESSGVLDGRFPAEGTRMSPCWSNIASIPNRPAYPCPAPAELTARLTVANGTNGFKILGDHYRFIGLEITRTTTPGIVFNLVDTTLGQPAGQQHDIIWDRCYLHGYNADAEFPYTTTGVSKETQRGIAFGQSNRFAVIDSYFGDFYCISSKGTCSDAQAVSWGVGGTQNSGWGTYKLVNNHLEASTEGILPGGSTGPKFSPPGCTPLVDCNVDTPTDIEVRRNFFFKPKTWNGNTTVIVTSGYPVVKNGFEFKTGVRMLIEGNVVRGTWPSAQTQAYAWSIAPKNQSGGNPLVGMCETCIVTDVSARYNYSYDIGGGPGIYTAKGSGCTNCTPLGGFRIIARDNLFDFLNKGSISSNSLVDGWEFTSIPGSPLDQIAIVHNTVVGGVRSAATWGASTTGLMKNQYFDNNIFFNGASGWLHIGGAGTCDQPFFNAAYLMLNACASPYSFQKNDILGGGATLCSGNTGCWPTDGFGANNFLHTTSSVLFTNYNGGDSGFNPGNYLLQVGSPDHLAGTDASGNPKDVGADIPALLNAISGVSQY